MLRSGYSFLHSSFLIFSEVLFIIDLKLTLEIIPDIILLISFTIVNVREKSYTFGGILSMYQGTNVTAIQSQQWLASSMTELMEEVPFHSITIGRLCDHAGLSRQTFYNVFDSKEDVLRFCIRNQYEEQFRKYSIKKNMAIEESIAVFTSVVGNSYKLQSLMVKNQLEGIMMDEMNRCVALFSDHFVGQDPNAAYVNAMVSGAMVNLLVYWMKQDDPISIDELTLLIKSFLEGTLFSHAVYQM